jgi:hypothetical protein
VERERKKAEKQAKFDQKNQKKAAAAPAESSKNKEKKAKGRKPRKIFSHRMWNIHLLVKSRVSPARPTSITYRELI